MLKVHAAFLISAISLSASAQEFFGGTDLDYWHQGPRPMSTPLYEKSESKPKKPPLLPNGSVIRQRDAGEFNWKDYEDPASDVFWDDGGEYVPPRPMRVAAANPTSENIAKYLAWQKKKLAVITRFEQEIAEQRHSEPSQLNIATTPKKTIASIQWEKISVIFFYSSTCAHCQDSLKTVAELRKRETQVIPVQMDWKDHSPLLPGSAKYDAVIAKEHSIKAVPSWVISYGGKVFELEGEVSVLSIENVIQGR